MLFFKPKPKLNQNKIEIGDNLMIVIVIVCVLTFISFITYLRQ